jgi:hypothetical protein
MPSSGMCRYAGLIRTDVSEECVASIFRFFTFLRNVGSNNTTRLYIPEDGIIQSHRRENLKSYIALTVTF